MYAYPDNHRRFALLGWMACELAKGLDRYWRPQLVHAHDWHAGLTCAYRPPTATRALGIHGAQPGLSGAVLCPSRPSCGCRRRLRRLWH